MQAQRRWFTVPAALSLAMYLAISGVMWHTSRHRHYYWTYVTYLNDPAAPANGTCQVTVAAGQLTALRHYRAADRLHADTVNRRGWGLETVAATSFAPPQRFWLDSDGAGWTIALPLWVLAVPFTIPPALWTVGAIRCRLRKHGTCLTCGYDLRATADRCPECGGEVGPSAPPVATGYAG